MNYSMGLPLANPGHHPGSAGYPGQYGGPVAHDVVPGRDEYGLRNPVEATGYPGQYGGLPEHDYVGRRDRANPGPMVPPVIGYPPGFPTHGGYYSGNEGGY
jgi:hypothetical protein